jgi:gluconolactonase
MASAPRMSSRALTDLLPAGGSVRRLATGFTFTEGPIFHPRDGYLLFSDMPADVRRRWTEQDGVHEVMRPSNKCNGMTYDANLDLIVCEHATSTLIRETAVDRQVLASHYDGKELNSPNDVVVADTGDIYFTDPIYGRRPIVGVERPQDLDFQGLYRVTDDPRSPELLSADFQQPNGLCFSPDGHTLYVDDTTAALIKAFEVHADGSLGSETLFLDGIGDGKPGTSAPDGMKTDALGNVYVTGPDGVWVISEQGDLLGVIEVPEKVANLNWGGADWMTLFICASTSLYAIQLAVPGSTSPYMRVAST